MKKRKAAVRRPPYMDAEEKEMMEAYFRGEYTSLPPEEQERERRLLRGETPQADIRLTLPKDALTRLKRKARAQGIPYQAFMTYILNQYAQGALAPAGK